MKKHQSYYKLEGKIPIPVKSIQETEGLFGKNDHKRIVGSDTINGIHISTVFLVIDHSFRDGPPILFETMIFGGKYDQYQDRYCTWEEAEVGHAFAVEMVKNTPLADRIKFYFINLYHNIKRKIRSPWSKKKEK